MATLTIIDDASVPNKLASANFVPIQLDIQSDIQRNSFKRDASKASADDYEQHELRDHIYQIPDTYIGSDEKIARGDRVLDLTDPKRPHFKNINLSLPEGVERLYLEIVSNAGDNVQRTREADVDIGKIEIFMDQNTVSIKNGGLPIPIQINKSTGMWAPDMIMGNLLTSSNYNDQRTGAGRNGYGAKLCNIFSKNYSIIVGDPYNNKKYTQTWTQNMTVRGEPIIEEGYAGEPFVHIIYQMDFKRFGYTQYPDEAFELFARHAADIAFTCKVPVTFNGTSLNAQNVHEYSRWMFPDNKNILVHYEWPTGTKTKNKRMGQSTVPISEDSNVMPIVELAVIDTPDDGSLLAYVNGIVTKEGGVHVDKAYRAVGDSVLSAVNNSRGNKKGDTKTRALKLDISNIKRHVTIVMSCRLMNPKFTSQQKTKLSAPAPQIKIDEKDLKPIMKWDLINRLYAELEAKQFRALGKTDGKKQKHTKIEKVEDANMAGTPRSNECTLCLTEGDSAGGYALKMISHIAGGRDLFGVYPLKGKPLNVMASTPMKIAENKEITELKQILGLREGVDYSIDSNYNSLRYGHVLILADADDDGKHICGLIMNIFYCRYPTLLQRGYLKFLRTPIVRVTKGSESFKFYTQSEYETWARQIPDITKWHHKYLKGLGSSSKRDIRDDQEDPRMVAFIYDDTCPNFFTLAFHPHKMFADARKDWIAQYKPLLNIETIQMLPISTYINNEFIEYSVTNVGRSIPGLDGLKKSQRKIIWGSMIKWGAKIGKSNIESMKTLRLVSAVADSTNYHHGETSLVEAINHMVFDFAGSNNMPAFFDDGNFGTRNKGGKDTAAARYTATRPQWWWPYLFRKEDHDTKKPRPYMIMYEDEGESWEPKYMLPVLPIGMINGCRGIGTGYSTFIPNYNPLDLCDWIRTRLTSGITKPLKPWYRDFKGVIQTKDRHIAVKSTTPSDSSDTASSGPSTPLIEISDDGMGSDHENDSDNDESYKENPLGSDEFAIEETAVNDSLVERKMSMITRGIFSAQNDGIHISELPIERNMHDYKNWLQKMLDDKVITDFENKCGSRGDGDANHIHFIVRGMKNPSMKKLRLEKSFGLTNMVMLDHNDKPTRYESDVTLMESWFQWRLPFYSARKDFQIQNIANLIKVKNDKIRFVQAVIAGVEKGFVAGETIIVMKQRKIDIYPQMDALNIPHELLKMTNLSNCTEDEISKIKAEIAKLEDDRRIISETSPGQVWMNELNEFEKAYCTHYKCSPNEYHSTPINTTSQMKSEVSDINDSTADGFINLNIV
jgi:DNA topoisomerase II